MILFFKECRETARSMVYYIFVIVFVLFMVSQLMDMTMLNEIKEPQPEQGYYGVKISNDEAAIMERTITNLMEETYRNLYPTYPFMFYKQVILDDKELQQMIDIIERAAGKSFETLEEEYNKYFAEYLSDNWDYEKMMESQLRYAVGLREDYTYKDFEADMEKVCQIIGRGSSYEKKKYESGVEVEMSYEEAVEEYEAVCSQDKITGAFARLFCDYGGIILALLPIFLGVTRCLRDKRAKAADVIYARDCSSAKLIAVRYAANLVLAFLPVLAVACIYQLPVFFRAGTLGVTPDYFAFLWYCIVWLLPEVMVVLAVSFFITELTEGILSIFIQVVWAFFSLVSAETLSGNFGFQLIARWNKLGSTAEFFKQRQELFINRGFYAIVSVLFLFLAILAYEKKRQRGVTFFGKIFKNRL